MEVEFKQANTLFHNLPLPKTNHFTLREIIKKCKADPAPNKVNLILGVYKNEQGESVPMRSVIEAEKIVANDFNLNKDYLNNIGEPNFLLNSQKFIFGDNFMPIEKGLVGSVQSFSATGAIKLVMEFVQDQHPDLKVYLPDPTWINHKNLANASHLEWVNYPYYNSQTREFDFENMMKFLNKIENRGVIILQACANNPTGCDPTREQWIEIAKVIKKKQLLAVFDVSYQGFASGCIHEDVFAPRHFMLEGVQTMVCHCFSKCFGLYGERVGSLHFYTGSPADSEKMVNYFAVLTRTRTGALAKHGPYLVNTIMGNPTLYKDIITELNDRYLRIRRMRQLLHDELVKLGTPGDWSHILKQTGFFGFIGLSPEHCQKLITDWHIYILFNGRINICGLNNSNVEYVAKGINSVVTGEYPRL